MTSNSCIRMLFFSLYGLKKKPTAYTLFLAFSLSSVHNLLELKNDRQTRNCGARQRRFILSLSRAHVAVVAGMTRECRHPLVPCFAPPSSVGITPNTLPWEQITPRCNNYRSVYRWTNTGMRENAYRISRYIPIPRYIWYIPHEF